LLEKGDLNEARKIIKHSEKNTGVLTSGMLDNKLWYCLQKEEWEIALDIANELTEERKPKFPEAYVHSAQVYLHFGEFELAVQALETSLTKRYTNTCSVDKQLTEYLIKGLKDETIRNSYVFVINNHVKEIALNKGFTVQKLEQELSSIKDKIKLEDIVVEPEVKKEVEKKEVEKEMQDDVDVEIENEDIGDLEILEEDEKDINTDISDDEDFSFFLREDEDVVIEEEEEFVEDDFSTDLTEEDEREPNIELDEDELKD